MRDIKDLEEIENGYTDDPQVSGPEEMSKKNNSKIYFFIIAIAALLATNVYFFVKFKSSGEKLYTMAIQKQDLQIEIDRIEAELDNLVSLSDENPDGALEASEGRAREVIKELRDKLEHQTITESDIIAARREVAVLKGDVSDLRISLNELKVKNDLLKRENSDLANQIAQVDQQVNVLAKENNVLKDQVVAASGLKVSNIQVNGVSIAKNGNVDVQTKTRKVDQLQIIFSIADNTLAKQGTKEIFVRIIDPVGNLFGDADNIFYVHGEKLQYTFKDHVNFTNKGEEYQFMWPLDKFQKGAYTVLLYNENAIMGRAGLVLK